MYTFLFHKISRKRNSGGNSKNAKKKTFFFLIRHKSRGKKFQSFLLFAKTHALIEYSASLFSYTSRIIVSSINEVTR